MRRRLLRLVLVPLVGWAARKAMATYRARRGSGDEAYGRTPGGNFESAHREAALLP